MVFYFESIDPRFVVFMGRDKYENEELLKYAFPEDVWFHVDNLSSAHVYLRRPAASSPSQAPMSISDIPKNVIVEMCQLVKANSIEGSKAESVDVIYCEFGNLVKRKGMEAGAVGYASEKANRYVRGVKKDPAVLKRIEKSREERNDINLAQLREDRDNEERHRLKRAQKEKEIKEKEDAKKEKEADDLLHYVGFQNKKDLMTSNKGGNVAEDDFM